MASDLKYLASYIIPVLFFLSLEVGDWTAYSVIFFSFLIVPALEWLIEPDDSNFSELEKSKRLSNRLFDILLYLNVPIVYGAIIAFSFRVEGMTVTEMIGFTLSLGILMGGNGINVAHELGHRIGKWDKLLGQVLLLPSLYMHFFIEHNRGHHLRVGTPMDPATARKGENIFAFWWRSATGGYIHAWELEASRLERVGRPVWGLSNLMTLYSLVELAYLTVMFVAFGALATVMLIIAAVVSFLLLECINYVEHYGLMRKKLESGRYEKVRSVHSWNSNHQMGRIILYELTRHSDHHFRASKKYQVLDHHEQSPQLPFGYPSSILISLIPPLWFAIMDPRIEPLLQRSPEGDHSVL